MTKKEKDQAKKFFRHPTRKKSVEPTSSDPMISIGSGERQLLIYLAENENRRFNLKEYSRNKKIPRSSVYDMLNRLANLEFVIRELANNEITEKGKIYLEATNRGVESVRLGVSGKENLSTHYHKFKLVISNREKFSMWKLERLNHRGIKENKLHNLHQVIVAFQDAKVVINPKQIIISLFEVISENVEEIDINSLSRALRYAELLKGVGLETEGMMVEEGHWARVRSVLSDFLFEKIDKRYFITLSDGSKFWIDHSGGKREDETDSKVVRARMDNFLNQIISDDYELKDIQKIKDSLGFITKLEATRLMDQIEENRLKRIQLEKEKQKPFFSDKDTIPSYFG